jgi:hypothetical protein
MLFKRIFVVNIPLLYKANPKNLEKHPFRPASGAVPGLKNITSGVVKNIENVLKSI